jgi:glycerol kinase
MNKYILALDQGTTSSRAIVFNHHGEPVATVQKEFSQIYPKPGWVEHDANEIWSTQAGVALEAIVRAGIDSSDLAAIGITNQRETTIIWDKRTGKPVYNAIVWQDRRTSDYCDQLKLEGHSQMIRQKTGLVIDAYFSATKIKWILDHVDGVRSGARDGILAFGTIDSWLIWNLTQGALHITDVSNASRTLLYNIHTLEWDRELLQLFEIPFELLPSVRSSAEIYGHTTGLFSETIPIAGIAGDQQAALFGQLCLHPGMVKNTYGTGCFIVMNTGNNPIESKNNLLTTIAWKIGEEVQYALEGSIFIGGAVVQWLRDGLGIIGSSVEVEELAGRVPDSQGVYFVPAFAGLGAPHWNQHARGMIVGLTRGSNASHIARAALDSIAYQTFEVLQSMQADSGIKLLELRVDGGAAVNNLLMQFQSDLTSCRVIRPKITETTALGAAYLAGLAVQYWKDAKDIVHHWRPDRVFTPSMTPEKTEELLNGWRRAIKTVVCWSGDTMNLPANTEAQARQAGNE